MAEDNGTMTTPQTQEGTDVTQATVEQPQTAAPRRGGRPPGNKTQQAARAANAADVQPGQPTENGQSKTSWNLGEVSEIRSLYEETLVEKDNQIENLKAQLQSYKVIVGEYFMVQRTLQEQGVDLGGS